MKINCNYVFTAALIVFAFASFSCKQDELRDLGFPRLNTLYVEMIPDTGAVFKGEILEIPGDCEIIDHGFVWSESKDATSSIEKLSLGETNKTGIFSAIANRAMVEGKKYYFKSFVETSKTTVFGNEIEFVSLGSHAPVITSIYPTSASWKDTIYIRGKYFSNVKYQMFPHFNDFLGELVYCTDTLMKTTVPIDLNVAISKVTIRYNNVKYSGKEFTLVPNVTVTSIAPLSGPWNTRIKIRGKNLRVAQTILFNEITSPIKFWSDTLLEVNVPFNLSQASSDVKVSVNGFTIPAPSPFTLIKGIIKSVTPSTGTYGTEVIIKTNNIRAIGANASVNGITLPVTARTDSSITVTMPILPTSGFISITLNDGYSNITYDKIFKYIIPEISGVSPGAWGDTIVISGKNFNILNNWEVYFGTNYYTRAEKAKIIAVDSVSIKVFVSQNHYSTYNQILVIANDHTYSNNLTLEIPTPVIEEVFSPSNYANPKVTIRGKNFYSKTIVRIVETGETLTLSSVTKNLIVANLPGLLRGKYSLEIYSSDGYSKSESVFSYNCLNWETPLSLFNTFNLDLYNSQTLIMAKGPDGKSFYLSTATPEIKNYYYQHGSQISVINNVFPQNLWTPANFNIGQKIYLCTGHSINPGSYTFNKAIFEFDPQTNSYINLQDFPGEGRTGAVGFSFNDKGYLISGGTNTEIFDQLWQFNSVTKSWSLIKAIDIDDRVTRIETITVDNFVYIFNKYNIWKFDPNNNILENISNVAATDLTPTPQPFFSRNNKIYCQLGRFQDECWEFDLITKTWRKLFNFPYTYQFIRLSYVVDNKVYLLINTWMSPNRKLVLLEFDPAFLN